MAEDNTALVQQLEQNIAAFEGAGMTEDAAASKAKLAKLTRSAAKESAKEAKK